MPRKISRLNAVEVVSVLQHHGFILISQRGSHEKWHNHTTGKQVIVPMHKGKELPIGTLKSIIDGSGIPESEFKN
ncbi:MAG: type II toxin-antitoxin system HicA family toxin [Dehalococcoidales bacterium]